MTVTASNGNQGVQHRAITRADVRRATIQGLRRVKADPQSLRLTAGQRRHITKTK